MFYGRMPGEMVGFVRQKLNSAEQEMMLENEGKHNKE